MINEDVFPAFRNIQVQVDTKYKRILENGKDPELELNQREIKVMNSIYPDNNINNPSYAKQKHDFFTGLGYKLPPLYKDGYVPIKPWWKFW